MGTMVSEVYEALIAAGAPEDKAKAAAEAIRVSDVLAIKQDFAKLDNRLARLELAVFGGGATGLALLIKLVFFS